MLFYRSQARRFSFNNSTVAAVIFEQISNSILAIEVYCIQTLTIFLMNILHYDLVWMLDSHFKDEPGHFCSTFPFLKY